MTKEIEIHENSDELPIVTRYEPGFTRVFARGSLVQTEDDEPDNIVQLAFWSGRDRDIEITDDDGETVSAVGYRLETEVMMEWDAIHRLHALLEQFIQEHTDGE